MKINSTWSLYDHFVVVCMQIRCLYNLDSIENNVHYFNQFLWLNNRLEV